MPRPLNRLRYAIRGYISTAGKHGADVLTALRDAITGQPWMPPIPDPQASQCDGRTSLPDAAAGL